MSKFIKVLFHLQTIRIKGAIAMLNLKTREEFQIPKYQKSATIKINGKPFKIEEDKKEVTKFTIINGVFITVVVGVCIYYSFGILCMFGKSFLGYDLLATIGANSSNPFFNIWVVLKWIFSM